jgi:adenine/guanine phosphoribosyltransferase-like PRPP-binding protein
MERGFANIFRGQPLFGMGPSPIPATEVLLQLLGGAVTVPCGPSVDFAIALDWFKETVEGGAIGDYTDLASLVNRGKSLVNTPSARNELKDVGTAVVGEIVEFIDAHPLLSDVDAIVAVPGHDARVLSFGSSVAFAVARDRSVNLIRCVGTQDYHAPVKHMQLEHRACALHGQFRCPDDVSGLRVLIVDDVYSSGATAEETARAVRAAGATGVASLAAVRTLRSPPL